MSGRGMSNISTRFRGMFEFAISSLRRDFLFAIWTTAVFDLFKLKRVVVNEPRPNLLNLLKSAERRMNAR